MLLANLTLPSTSTSIAVGGLEGGTSYAFRAAAWTRVGIGPASPFFVLTIDKVAITSVPSADQGEVDSIYPPGALAQVCNIFCENNFYSSKVFLKNFKLKGNFPG